MNNTTATTQPIPIDVACPHCGSDSIATDDLVSTCSRVCFVLNEDGQIEAQYTGQSDTYWESQHPAYEATPYKCQDCDEPLTLHDLVPDYTLAPLPLQVREYLINALADDLLVTGLSTMELGLIATAGFQPFYARPDAELLNRYVTLHGEQGLLDLVGDDKTLATVIAAIRGEKG